MDIGGSGMKGAIIDVNKGILVSERFRLKTPQPPTPKNMLVVLKKIIEHFNWTGPVGCGFPTSIKNGVVLSASNLDNSWVGKNVVDYFEEATKLPFVVVNDADAAGVAEMNFGAGKDTKGLAVIITIGTGLGSGVFYNGMLLENFELGQMYYKKYKTVEKYASNSVRKNEKMSFKKWGKRFSKFLNYVELIVSPDVFILGGGGSKYYAEYKQYLNTKTPILLSQTLNEAGLIGAAIAAAKIESNQL